MANALVAQAAARSIKQYGAQMTGLLETLSQDKIWEPGPGGANAIGTLAHHLTGNLRHYLGAGVLKDGYVRDRPAEFGDRDISKDTLISNLTRAVEVALKALDAIDQELADSPHREPDGRESATLGSHVISLTAHFAYHLGQADYAARMRPG